MAHTRWALPKSLVLCILVGGVLCWWVFLVSALPSAARRNQNQVVQFLQTAYAEYGRLSDGSAGLYRVHMRARRYLLWDREVSLIPGIEQSVAGYKLKASAAPAGFTVLACPEVPKKTGLLSFFRDETGRIWWESPAKKPIPGHNFYY